MAAAQLTLVLGGVRSGKSAFAEGLIAGSDLSALYLATGQATDEEMAERIRLHRERRPSHWQTLEEPLALVSALAGALSEPVPPRLVLLDSLDVWVANLLLAHENEEPAAVETQSLSELDLLASLCRQKEAQTVLVSSEVGLSPVPPNPLGRRFQDLLGTINRQAASLSDAVYLVVAGIPLQIKPRE